MQQQQQQCLAESYGTVSFLKSNDSIGNLASNTGVKALLTSERSFLR